MKNLISNTLKILTIILLLSIHGLIKAQNFLSVEALDSMLLAGNPDLQKAQLELQKTQNTLLQERLWDNPTLGLEQNVYNPNNGRYFDLSSQGESILTVTQQLPKLGEMKHRRMYGQAILTSDSIKLKCIEYDLLKEMHRNCIEMHYAELSSSIYDSLIWQIETLLTQMEIQCQNGQMAHWEVERIRTFLLTMRKDRLAMDLQKLMSANQIKNMLNKPAEWHFDLAWEYDTSLYYTLTDRWMQQPATSAPIYRLAESQLSAAVRNEQVQRSLGRPAIALSATYDKAGNFVNNYYAVGLNIELPAFNRNQGGRKSARLEMSQAQLTAAIAASEIDKEKKMFYQMLSEQRALLEGTCHRDDNRLEVMRDGVAKSLQARQINAAQYIDFYQGYIDRRLAELEIQKNINLIVEEIKSIAGAE